MEPDWNRETPTRLWDPPRRLLRSLRGYQRASMLTRWFYVLSHRFWSMVTGCDIPINSLLGGGLLIPHPNGIVIHQAARIGANCLIMQQVTIGGNQGTGVPTVGDGVDIGPGAKILGRVTVGDRAMVGACSLVMKDVPAGAVVYGIPATVRRLRDPSG